MICSIFITVISCQKAYSQSGEIEVPNINDYGGTIKINDTIDYFLVNETNTDYNYFKILKFDKSQNSIDTLGTFHGMDFINSSILTSEGIYFLTYYYEGNDVVRKLHWLNHNGQTVSSEILSPTKLLSADSVNLYFSIQLANNSYELKSFNRTNGQINSITTTNKQFLFSLEDESINYFVTLKSDGNLSVDKYSSGIGFQNFLNTDIPSNLNNTIYRGKFHGKHYISKGENNQHKIYELNLNTPAINLIAEHRYYNSGSNYDFDSGIFTAIADEYIATSEFSGEFKYYYVRGLISDSTQVDTIRFSNELAQYKPMFTEEYFLKLNNNVIRGYTYFHGFEPFYVSDSIYLLKDVSSNIQNGWVNQFENQGSRFPYFIHQNGIDTIFTVMSNFKDDKLYLYSIKDSIVKSYFPLENVYYVKPLSIFNNHFYSTYILENKLTIQFRSLVENLEPQPTVEDQIQSDVWARNLVYVNEQYYTEPNNMQQLSSVKLMKDGAVIAATRSGQSYKSKIANEEYKIIDDAYGGYQIYKLDSLGKLIWNHSSGDKYFGNWANYPLLVEVDSLGDIYMSGVFFKNYYFEDDTITVNRCGNFLMKLDGETGEKIWFKLISENFYFDDFNIDQMKIKGENIYLSFSYRDFNCTIDGVSLSNSLVSPINALAKFNVNGDFISAQNTPTEWTDYNGLTWTMDISNDQIITIQSQGAYNIWASCEYKNYGYFNQIMDLNGTVKDVVPMYSSDLGSVRCGFINDNSFNAFGYYRGTLDLDVFENTTPTLSSCNANRGFMYQYNFDDGFSELKISNESFFPFASKIYGSYYYVYGRGANKELIIVKFSKDGKEIGYKRLGQYLDDLTFKAYQMFDVNDDYLVISGDSFEQNADYLVPGPISLYRYLTVIKTKNDAWLNDKKIFENKPRIFNSNIDDDLVIYPNPSNGMFSIKFENPIYTNLDIYSVNGEIIYQGQLNDKFDQQFNIINAANGLYIARIYNNEVVKTIRIIKN
jgi:hypothetical protein